MFASRPPFPHELLFICVHLRSSAVELLFPCFGVAGRQDDRPHSRNFLSQAKKAWSFRAPMRIFLTGWIVLCVLAGLNVRVLAAGADHAGFCCGSAEISCAPDHCVCPSGEHPVEDGGCPGGEHRHHHHACCSYLSPVAVEEMGTSAPAVFGSKILGIRPEGEIAPDAPFLGSEKPPLI